MARIDDRVRVEAESDRTSRDEVRDEVDEGWRLRMLPIPPRPEDVTCAVHRGRKYGLVWTIMKIVRGRGKSKRVSVIAME